MSECEHKHTGSCSPAGVYLYVKCMDCGAILNESEDGRRLRTECPGFKAERYAPGSCERCHHDAQHHYDALAAENAALRENANLAARLAEAERDAVRYRWLRDRAWPFEFNGDTPADADAAIDAAMRPPAKKHTPRPGAHDNIANVIVQANLASTLTSHPSLSPTHCCVDCGALWRQCDDFSMNLRSASCCDACNNAPVGPQIRPIYVAPSSADIERRPCTCHPDDNPPVPCPRMYALQDCRRAAALAAEIESLRARLADLQGERDVAELSRDAAHARLAECESQLRAVALKP